MPESSTRRASMRTRRRRTRTILAYRMDRKPAGPMRVVIDVKPAPTFTLFAFAAVSTGCADRETVYHDLDGGSSMQEIVDRAGNFPEPAVTVCGQLPQDVAPISGLAAAWAVESMFETWDSPGPYAGIRLRFSDWGFECADDFPSAEGVCE